MCYLLVWRVHNKFSPPPRDVAHCCTDICTGAGLYWQGLWRVSLGERQLLLRSTLTGSLTFIGSVIAVLVKYLSAWDECWGKGIESPSGSNVIDGIGVANPFQLSQHHSSAPDWPWCLTYRLVWRVHNKFSPPPRQRHGPLLYGRLYRGWLVLAGLVASVLG